MTCLRICASCCCVLHLLRVRMVSPRKSNLSTSSDRKQHQHRHTKLPRITHRCVIAFVRAAVDTMHTQYLTATSSYTVRLT
jgi:hypothetical protein